MAKPILLSWSGGKDSAWALHLLRADPAYEVVALLTTVNQQFHRVAMHGFREELLDAQAAAIMSRASWSVGSSQQGKIGSRPVPASLATR